MEDTLKILQGYIGEDIIFLQILPVVGFAITSATITQMRFGRSFAKTILLIALIVQVLLWSISWNSTKYPQESLFSEVELKRGFDNRELRKTMKTMSRKYHPDMKSNEDEKTSNAEIFGHKQSILEFLKNGYLRDIYDRFGVDLRNSSLPDDFMQEYSKNVSLSSCLNITQSSYAIGIIMIATGGVHHGAIKPMLSAFTFRIAYDLYYYGLKNSANMDPLDLLFPYVPLHQRKVFIDLLFQSMQVFLCAILLLEKNDIKLIQIPEIQNLKGKGDDVKDALNKLDQAMNCERLKLDLKILAKTN